MAHVGAPHDMNVIQTSGQRRSGYGVNGRRRIVALLPGLADYGGIQRYNRIFCHALTEYGTGQDVDLEIVSLADPVGWRSAEIGARSLRGCGGNGWRFGVEALAALARPYDLLINGHVDFGMLALPGHMLRPHTPLLTMIHGVEVWKLLPSIDRAALRRSDRVVSVSVYTATRAAALQGVSMSALRVIPPSLDPGFLAAVHEWQPGAATTGARLLTISRLSSADAYKGIDRVIAALPEVQRRVSNVRYTIVGDGDDRARLERLARAHGVAECIHFEGHVSDERLHSLLRAADLFVLPSQGEGFGIVFLEAMAYGKPVIAGAHGGAPEVVTDGEEGLLVEHDDTVGLCQAIVSLLLDPVRRRVMGEAGRERVRHAYSYVAFRSAIASLLDELLALAITQRRPHRLSDLARNLRSAGSWHPSG